MLCIHLPYTYDSIVLYTKNLGQLQHHSSAYLRVVGVLVEALVEGQLEQLQCRYRARVLVCNGADQLKVAYGLRLREDVVELVPHLSTH